MAMTEMKEFQLLEHVDNLERRVKKLEVALQELLEIFGRAHQAMKEKREREHG